MDHGTEEIMGLTIIIQAGGGSSRMGQDKGLIKFLGQPLVAHVYSRVNSLADDIQVTTNDPQGYRFLGVPLVADLYPGRGALGGLYTAMFAARNPVVGVVACDMPFVNPAMLSAQRDKLFEMNADLVIPQTASGLEPFHTVYSREACLFAIEAALRANKKRVDSWFSDVKLVYFIQEEINQYDPYGRAFFNINTFEDLIEAEGIALKIERD